MTIETAKQFLREQGYYTDNLWHIDDVKSSYECTDEEAYEVLNDALKNEATMEQIWLSIDHSADNKGHRNKPIQLKNQDI